MDSALQPSQGKRFAMFKKVIITGADNVTPYMIRYIIARTPWGALYLHHFLRSDEDRCLHDHPWPFTSIILTGGYFEETPCKCGIQPDHTLLLWYGLGSVLRRPAEWRHRVVLKDGVQPWTLVFVGRRRRKWGFWTKSGWIYWREFLQGKNNGEDLC